MALKSDAPAGTTNVPEAVKNRNTVVGSGGGVGGVGAGTDGANGGHGVGGNVITTLHPSWRPPPRREDDDDEQEWWWW
jgi:hypothetical protein